MNTNHFAFNWSHLNNTVIRCIKVGIISLQFFFQNCFVRWRNNGSEFFNLFHYYYNLKNPSTSFKVVFKLIIFGQSCNTLEKKPNFLKIMMITINLSITVFVAEITSLFYNYSFNCYKKRRIILSYLKLYLNRFY